MVSNPSGNLHQVVGLICKNIVPYHSPDLSRQAAQKKAIPLAIWSPLRRDRQFSFPHWSQGLHSSDFPTTLKAFVPFAPSPRGSLVFLQQDVWEARQSAHTDTQYARTTDYEEGITADFPAHLSDPWPHGTEILAAGVVIQRPLLSPLHFIPHPGGSFQQSPRNAGGEMTAR
jgi:hypothetical protein